MQPFLGSSHAKSGMPLHLCRIPVPPPRDSTTLLSMTADWEVTRGRAASAMHVKWNASIHPFAKKQGCTLGSDAAPASAPAQVQTLKRLTFLQQDSFTWLMLRNGYNRVNF